SPWTPGAPSTSPRNGRGWPRTGRRPRRNGPVRWRSWATRRSSPRRRSTWWPASASGSPPPRPSWPGWTPRWTRSLRERSGARSEPDDIVSREFDEVNRALEARGFARMEFDLSRILSLLDLLGMPQRAYPSIHITGTNGKTSTARMIDAPLGAHGLRTGRYTSPHLATVRERISLDGEPIDERRFVQVYKDVAPVAELVDKDVTEPLTYFDMTTTMAFAAFADAPVDAAIVEVGLGGAEDSTNVLHARIAVITPIGLDHTEWLGDTIADIAWAKAGIVHNGATLILAAQPDEALTPIYERAVQVDAIQEEFAFRRLVAVVAILADKDATGMLELLEPVVDAVVVTRNSSTRAMPVAQLAEIAVEVFGEDRVTVEPKLSDAIVAAVQRAEENGELSGAGVI